MTQTFFLICLSFILLFTFNDNNNTQCLAKPATFDGNDDADFFQTSYEQQTRTNDVERSARRIDNGYYYISNGYITRIPDTYILNAYRRHQYTDDNGIVSIASAETNAKYRHPQHKRKKLFVANIFG